MYYGVTILFVIVLVLSAAGFQGVLKFRSLTKSIRNRANELPIAATLAQNVSDLRVVFSQIAPPRDFESFVVDQPRHLEVDFRQSLQKLNRTLDDYIYQLKETGGTTSGIADTSNEQETVRDILRSIRFIEEQQSWSFLLENKDFILDELDRIQLSVGQLPGFMKQRMDAFARAARTKYHTWMTISAFLTINAALLIYFLARRFNRRIFQPLELLFDASRQVARGNFNHRIKLNSEDEMSELAEALNAMTRNFQEIKRDLDCQVQQRTREVVRSEQMASVGFLSAGIAHEINNPLASIAWSAESLETRLHDILNPTSAIDTATRDAEIEEMKQYLRRIQDEAFRCKGITSGLLDFSRLGDARKSPHNLREIIETVVEIVKPLKKYREHTVRVDCESQVQSAVNDQEIKQVVLNLITNALDSLTEPGTIFVRLKTIGDQAEIVVEDQGCGMTPEVLQHIFEPFFTRRQDGQGTGLGLSITYRIIEEHGGTIVAQSPGPGRGSTFTVNLPLVNHEHEQQPQAA